MTQNQQEYLSRAIRKSLQIGDRVLIIPRYTIGDKLKKSPLPRIKIMYVRELHNPSVAGLSRTLNGTVYGIQYGIIHPY